MVLEVVIVDNIKKHQVGIHWFVGTMTMVVRTVATAMTAEITMSAPFGIQCCPQRWMGLVESTLHSEMVSSAAQVSSIWRVSGDTPTSSSSQ